MKHTVTAMKRALILTGDGINCEVETASACRAAGFDAKIAHLAELTRDSLQGISLLVIPGGFSFGDELGSGRVLALRIRHELGWDLPAFARAGGVVIGICNGFQVLVSLGVFGDGVALAHNREGRFINKWVSLKAEPCDLLKDIREIDLPIRHGEGRLLFDRTPNGDSALGRDAFPALRYSDENPNGSTDAIAGLTDKTGRIFGLMPHPEAFRRESQHPEFYRQRALGTLPAESAMSDGAGLTLFKNAYQIAEVTP